MRTVQCIALACLFASTAASAQTPNDKIKFEVTKAELQVIGQGLMELPYKVSAQVMNNLQAQLNAADQAAAKAAQEAAKPKDEKPAEQISPPAPAPAATEPAKP